MDEQTRRAVAHAAYVRIKGKGGGAIYSYSEGRHTHISGQADNAFDHEAGAHISSTGSGIYHHGKGAHITLDVKENKFTGFDHATGSHFSGTLNGSTIQLYDYAEGKYFTYAG